MGQFLPLKYILQSCKNASRLNRYNFQTVNAINCLFSILYTTPLRYWTSQGRASCSDRPQAQEPGGSWITLGPATWLGLFCYPASYTPSYVDGLHDNDGCDYDGVAMKLVERKAWQAKEVQERVVNLKTHWPRPAVLCCSTHMGSFPRKGTQRIFIKMNHTRLNPNGDFLFSTLHTTSFLYVDIYFGHRSVEISFQIRCVRRGVLSLLICSVR